MKRPFGRGLTPVRGPKQSPWLLTTYKSWDDPPSTSYKWSYNPYKLEFWAPIYTYLLGLLCRATNPYGSKYLLRRYKLPPNCTRKRAFRAATRIHRECYKVSSPASFWQLQLGFPTFQEGQLGMSRLQRPTPH